MEVTTFTCSICGETSRDICVYCTKDACANHLCERCRRCSDCCQCELALVDQHEHAFGNKHGNGVNGHLAQPVVMEVPSEADFPQPEDAKNGLEADSADAPSDGSDDSRPN